MIEKEIVLGSEDDKAMMQPKEGQPKEAEAQNKCSELTHRGMCKKWFKRCNTRCHSKY